MHDALALVGLEDVVERLPAELTQGERKLVGVARALAASPARRVPRRARRRPRHGRERAARTPLRQVVDRGRGDAAGRSRHGPRAQHLRPHRRARVRQVIASGTPDEVRRDRRVVEAYLGGAGARQAADTLDIEVRVSDAVLSIEALTAGYDGAPVVRDARPARGRRRGGRAARAPTAPARRRRCARSRGSLRPLSGRILFAGTDTAKIAPAALARRGIAHVPEGRGLFFGLTVAEHFRLGHRGEHLDAERRLRVLPRPAPSCAARPAGLLSGGEQQMLAVARALVRRPAPAAARRAQPRPGAGDRRAPAARGAHVRARERLRGPARRAARAARAGDRRPRLRALPRRGRARARRRRTCAATSSCSWPATWASRARPTRPASPDPPLVDVANG